MPDEAENIAQEWLDTLGEVPGEPIQVWIDQKVVAALQELIRTF